MNRCNGQPADCASVLPTWWLALMLLAALILRGCRLDDAILSLDEASSWRVASRSQENVVLHCAANVHPPAYFLLLKVWMMVAGDSPWALRSLSALLGTVSVVAVYLLVLESLACLPGNNPPYALPQRRKRCANAGALFAAALLAFSPLQVQIGRTARMYSLAVLLALVSSWLLLRARCATTRLALWWSAYGVSVALMCYTHNYGLLTAAAQALFVVGELVVAARRAPLSECIQRVVLPAFAFSLALCLYSPWIAVLQSQTAEVRTGYWIPPLDADALHTLFAAWVAGINYASPWLIWLFAVACLATVALVVTWRHAGLWLVLLQAAVPWFLAVAFSLCTRQSILQVRYLAMAQAAMYALLGACLCLAYQRATSAVVGKGHQRASDVRLSRRRKPGVGLPFLLVLAVVLVAPLLGLSLQSVMDDSHNCDGIEAAVEAIERHRARDDLVLVSRPGEVNRGYYYLHRTGIDDLPVRCRHNPFTTRHVPHLGSLTSEDVFADGPQGVTHCWRLASTDEVAAVAPANVQFQWERTYGTSLRFSLSRYASEPATAAGIHLGN